LMTSRFGVVAASSAKKVSPDRVRAVALKKENPAPVAKTTKRGGTLNDPRKQNKLNGKLPGTVCTPARERDLGDLPWTRP
jgi:hypothetical protein